MKYRLVKSSVRYCKNLNFFKSRRDVPFVVWGHICKQNSFLAMLSTEDSMQPQPLWQLCYLLKIVCMYSFVL